MPAFHIIDCHFLIHLLNKYLRTTYCVPVTGLPTGDWSENRTDFDSGAYTLLGKPSIKQISKEINT